MRKLILILCLSAFGLASCGGDDNSIAIDPADPTDPNTPTGPTISKIDVITNNPQIPSDGGIPAMITAFVKDDSNNFVEGVDVQFAASSGGLLVTQATTDENGTASASLSTAGDPTNRTITVTASAGDLTQTINVFVTGSQLSITGPSDLVQGDRATYTIVLIDGAGNGIAGRTIDIASESGNPLEATTLTTDAEGQAQVVLTATVGGGDLLTATGLGLSTTFPLEVSDDSFSFRTPGLNAEIDLGAVEIVEVEWLQDGAPRVGETVRFSTTRGEFVGLTGPPEVTTGADGRAQISIRSNNAGPAVVTADAIGGPTTQRAVEFIATDPATIDVQSNPFTIAPNNQATITAVVRDPDNNRVKNARVAFSLSDVTGGTLSVGNALTDSQGRAQTFYTASDVVGTVTIRATIETDTSITDAVTITIARRELFVAIGTGNSIIEPDPASYEIPYLVIVTDSEGNGVPDADIQVDVRSVRYSKGIWVLGPDQWFFDVFVTCDDEDLNGNGIIDDDEVDANSNGTIEAGNVVAVVNGNTTTDAEGRASVTLRYAQVYAIGTEVQLRVKVTVTGTEFEEELRFVLPILADDVTPDQAPPGLLKPPDLSQGDPRLEENFLSGAWGYARNCSEDF